MVVRSRRLGKRCGRTGVSHASRRAFRALLSMRRFAYVTHSLILRSGPKDRVSKDAGFQNCQNCGVCFRGQAGADRHRDDTDSPPGPRSETLQFLRESPIRSDTRLLCPARPLRSCPAGPASRWNACTSPFRIEAIGNSPRRSTAYRSRSSAHFNTPPGQPDRLVLPGPVGNEPGNGRFGTCRLMLASNGRSGLVVEGCGARS